MNNTIYRITGKCKAEAQLPEKTQIDLTQEAERAGFVARLEEISAAVGNRAALAKAAGIAATSLQAYFQHSEPTRVVLINLARAANVSVGWLATGRESRRPDGLPEGYFAIRFVDLGTSGGHIYPLLTPAAEFRIFKNSDFDEVSNHDLIAVQISETFQRDITESDMIVVDQTDRPSIRSGPLVSKVFPLQRDGIYLVARQARAMLRQLRWKKPGESLMVLVPGSKSESELIATEKTLDFQIIGRVVWRGGAII